MAKATKKSKRKSLLKSNMSNEASLLRDCVAYAQTVASAMAAYSADPTPNCDIANERSIKLDASARQLLLGIAETPTKTAAGLQAKARIAAIAIRDDDGQMRDELAKFFTSLAADLKQYLDPAVKEEWRDSDKSEAA